MKVRVNGEEREVRQATSLAELLLELGLGQQHLAIDHNGRLIEGGSSFPRIELSEGDRLEIVRFVGGG